MSNNECALCDVEITDENDTNEHVIPNAIGGQKKLSGFICKPCNNQSGDEWESDLAKQLNPLCLFFGISRDRGDVPSQQFETTGGEKVSLNADGTMDIAKPVYKESQHEAGVNIHISARSTKEAKKMLKGVKRKYPQANLEDLVSNAEERSFYPSDMIKFNLSLGGEMAGRSIVKSALALVVETGVPAKDCEHAREYLTNSEGEACFGYYYEKDVVTNRPEGIPIHCVYVKCDSNSQQILGYVEYFGVQRMVMELSSNYSGKDFQNIYAINPMTGDILELNIDLQLSPSDIQESYNYKKIPEGSVEDALSRVIPTGMKLSVEKEKDRVLNSAVQYAFKNCGVKEGEVLTEEHMKKVSSLVYEKLEPFLLHQLTIGRRSHDV
jgi:hypothetical protein